MTKYAQRLGYKVNIITNSNTLQKRYNILKKFHPTILNTELTYNKDTSKINRIKKKFSEAISKELENISKELENNSKKIPRPPPPLQPGTKIRPPLRLPTLTAAPPNPQLSINNMKKEINRIVNSKNIVNKEKALGNNVLSMARNGTTAQTLKAYFYNKMKTPPPQKQKNTNSLKQGTQNKPIQNHIFLKPVGMYIKNLKNLGYEINNKTISNLESKNNYNKLSGFTSLRVKINRKNITNKINAILSDLRRKIKIGEKASTSNAQKPPPPPPGPKGNFAVVFNNGKPTNLKVKMNRPNPGVFRILSPPGTAKTLNLVMRNGFIMIVKKKGA